MYLTKSRAVIAVLLAVIASLSIIGATRLTASTALSFAQAGDGARRITPDEVRALLKENKAVIVDVRGKDAYNGGHIKGALSIPFAEIEERAKELPPDKTIVTYCS